MLTWLLSKLSAYLWPIVAAVGLSLLLALGVQTKRLDWAKSETQEVRNAWAAASARATSEALALSEKYRATTQQLQAKVDDAERSYATLQAVHARELVRARADVVSLRDKLAVYARSSDPASDTQAAASERAAVLGGLLAEALRADAESAADAEANADAVRTVLDAWPR